MLLSNNPGFRFTFQFIEDILFQTLGKSTKSTDGVTGCKVSDTPEEALENSYQQIRDGLISELLQIIKESDPGFFEQLVLDVLINMGYGGSRR